MDGSRRRQIGARKIGRDGHRGNILSGMQILHVTNGDVAADSLAQTGLEGDILPWRDVLHDGPVRPDADRRAFAEERVAFLADRRWGTPAALRATFAERDARLDACTAADAIVLWFEPDLYDQLQLMQVLARLSHRAESERPAISIVPADHLLGPLSPERYPPLFAHRRPIREEDCVEGRAAWEAFTASSPETLGRLAGAQRRGPRSYADDDAVRVPHLSAALRRLLEEYPSEDQGLSRSERQICEALEPGRITLEKLFPAAHHATESWPWLGDLSFAWYVERLSQGARPLITHDNGSRVLMTPDRTGSRRHWERQVMLTPFGREVLRTRADAIDGVGLDRWIGGVHLTPNQPWRWQATTGTLVR